MPDRTAAEAIQNKYPPMPESWRPFIDSGIKQAESELESDTDDVIPGTFNAADNIPPELIEAVMARESSFNKDATNPDPCNQYGGHATGLGQFCLNPGGKISGSLELQDYHVLTGQDVTEHDVKDPESSIHFIAFGLGDRYSRLKQITGKEKPRNWFLSVVGYSPPGDGNPLVQNDGSIDSAVKDQYTRDYLHDLKDYVAANYGEKRAKEIENSGDAECGRFDFVCTAMLALNIGKNAAEGGATAVSKMYISYLKKMAVYFGAAVLVIFGLVIMARKNAEKGMGFVAKHPEVLAAL